MANITRRQLLLSGSSTLALGPLAAVAGSPAAAGQREGALVKFGILTDMHYDPGRAPARGRYHTQSLDKLQQAVDAFREADVAFAVNLGDHVHADRKAENLRAVVDLQRRLEVPAYHVAGNMDISPDLPRAEFLDICGQDATAFSFDKNGVTFITLDAQYSRAGVSYDESLPDDGFSNTDIPAEQQQWLKRALERAQKPTIVFIHQRLDRESAHNWTIHSSGEVRRILEESRKVSAVFQGHNHINDVRLINGIAYCTFEAVVDGEGASHNAYSVIGIYEDGRFDMSGYAQHGHHPFLGPVGKYRCGRCGYLYDPEAPEGTVAPGTPFAGIPHDWLCPWCGARKFEFEMI